MKGLAEMEDLSPDDNALLAYMMDVKTEEILDAVGEGIAEIKDILAALMVRLSKIYLNAYLSFQTIFLDTNF